VQADLHVADALQVEPALLSVQAPTLSVLPLDRVEAAGGPEAGIARLLAVLTAPIEGGEGGEGGEGPIEALEGAPADGDAVGEDFGPHRPQLGEVSALVDVVDRAMLPAPGPSPCLQGRVVELALNADKEFEGRQLAAGWLEEVAEGPTGRHDFERIEGL